MKKLMLIAALVAALTGCQTRITAVKHAEAVHPIQKVVQVNGQDQVIIDRYEISSGGWEATARSPLYAQEALNGLELGVETNGTVKLALGSYNRDLSPQAVTMVKEMFAGGANLAIAIGDAYTKIAGGGAQADTVMSMTSKAYNAFTTSGGDASKARVTINGETFDISDGSVCTTCTADGNCTTGNCSE